jgi:hypothetical protein
MIDQKQPDSVKHFKYLKDLIKNDADRTPDINFRTPWQKKRLTRKRFFSPAN